MVGIVSQKRLAPSEVRELLEAGCSIVVIPVSKGPVEHTTIRTDHELVGKIEAATGWTSHKSLDGSPRFFFESGGVTSSVNKLVDTIPELRFISADNPRQLAALVMAPD